ncbi:hypothetical protein MNEG_8248 [Monoraphidium neglectum]|uniref:Uncharacterized protein n=1 Tax=Monoraphidium neglectum TaxID=145388 RepID=A0A0D2N080_9CHLO|nr:hypothetical protein MNEG_8248 [Monoraphidium neglectum]KIY99710.1 hypothetical protein MNEG_8248 [Monoraphidium neglectum]|eukprot:XP_013898730.1 hypothetical protein MNEG_8248 [Monoraphidium neglectum]
MCGLDQGIGQHDDIIYNHSIAFCNKCRQQRSCFQTLDTEFTKLTQHIIGTNKEATKKVLGKGCVVVSRGNLSEARAEGVCQFKDVDDLLQAIRASSYVPGWSGKASSIMFRGQPAFDGAFSQYIPCPPGVTFCIKVSGLPVWDTGRAISSLAGGELLPTLNLLGSTVSNILGAQPLQSLQRAVNEDLVGTMGLQTWFKVFATIQRPGLFDIYPGKFGRSPLTQTQWALYMLTPPPKEVILQMYQAGQDDARTWAKQMGWPKA